MDPLRDQAMILSIVVLGHRHRGQLVEYFQVAFTPAYISTYRTYSAGLVGFGSAERAKGEEGEDEELGAVLFFSGCRSCVVCVILLRWGLDSSRPAGRCVLYNIERGTAC